MNSGARLGLSELEPKREGYRSYCCYSHDADEPESRREPKRPRKRTVGTDEPREEYADNSSDEECLPEHVGREGFADGGDEGVDERSAVKVIYEKPGDKQHRVPDEVVRNMRYRCVKREIRELKAGYRCGSTGEEQPWQANVLDGCVHFRAA